jgi:hypothetical protein
MQLSAQPETRKRDTRTVIGRAGLTRKALWLGFGVAALVLTLYLAVSPVILRIPFFEEEHSREPRVVIFNPFRNRGPEIAANEALLSIKNGRCKETLQSADDMGPERRAHICEMIGDFGLVAWQLRNRTDNRNQCDLYYWHDGYPSLWVMVRKKEGKWKVTWINVIY